MRDWSTAFAQSRSAERAIEQALGSLLALGRRTLSRSLWALGRQHQDWSAAYKLHSRARWQAQDLFQPILQRAASLCDDSCLVVAMDDTRIRKTGRKILSAFYQRDPQSPKFRFNLMWGLRFLHVSLLVPLYRSHAIPPRSLPVRFLEVPAIKKPGRKATPLEIEAYQQAVKEFNLSRCTVTTLQQLRQSADAVHLASRTILAVGDGGFCNRTLFRPSLDRIEILARTRRDCRLCPADTSGGRRFYSVETFTPEQIRQRESEPWRQARIFHGGQWREVRYKEIFPIYWRVGAAKRPLRLFVVAPIPYDSGKGKRKYYRDPAFLLTTNLHSSAPHPPPGLLRPLADRGEPPGNQRHFGNRTGPVAQSPVRPTSAGHVSCCLQRLAVGRNPSLRRYTIRHLPVPAQVAA